jgi:tRNA-splicing ligase RtcB
MSRRKKKRNKGRNMKLLTDGKTLLNEIVDPWANSSFSNCKVYEDSKKQALNVANSPYTCDKVILFSNAQQDDGIPYGCMFTTSNAIVPAGLGSDIGCGILATKTSIKRKDITDEALLYIYEEIRQKIPTLNCLRHEDSLYEDKYSPEPILNKFDFEDYVLNKQLTTIKSMYGTIGGAGHYIMIGEDSQNFIWIIVHAGPSYLGYLISGKYNFIAKSLNKIYYSIPPVEFNIPFLPISEDIGKAFFIEVSALNFIGLSNREILSNWVYNKLKTAIKTDSECTDKIDTLHNSLHVEEIDKKIQLITHRKGVVYTPKDNHFIFMQSPADPLIIFKSKGNEYYDTYPVSIGQYLFKSDLKTLYQSRQNILMEKAGILNSIKYTERMMVYSPDTFKSIGHFTSSRIKHSYSPFARIKPLIMFQPS